MEIRIKKALIAILVVLVILFIFSGNSNPSFPIFYQFKRIQEKIFLGLKISPNDQIEYRHSLLNNRLIELESIVANKKYDYLLYASLRYSTTAGEITDLIIQTDSEDKVSPTTELFMKHKSRLQILVNNYPKDQNMEWKYLQDDINYLILYLEKFNQFNK